MATLIRMTGNWDLAEECAQDAFAVALERWPRDGVPRSPGAWLTTTARNRALDRLRRSTTEAAKLKEAAVLSHTDEPDDDGDDGTVRDDRLRLIFTCCHPALPLEARVALTLRTLAGLTTAEIARAFLVAEPTMAKRLVRALMPEDGEVAGLLALMLLTEARRTARVSGSANWSPSASRTAGPGTRR